MFAPHTSCNVKGFGWPEVAAICELPPERAFRPVFASDEVIFAAAVLALKFLRVLSGGKSP